MSYAEDIEKWKKYAKARGLNPSLIEAPADRIFRRMGLKLPPMVLWGFTSVAVFMGLIFGFLFAVVQLFLDFRERELINSLIAIAAASAFYGLFMAAFHNWNKRKLKLPSWSEFKEMTTTRIDL